jgi:hypothetical protein
MMAVDRVIETHGQKDALEVIDTALGLAASRLALAEAAFLLGFVSAMRWFGSAGRNRTNYPHQIAIRSTSSSVTSSSVRS